jgi:hypothetical protein
MSHGTLAGWLRGSRGVESRAALPASMLRWCRGFRSALPERWGLPPGEDVFRAFRAFVQRMIQTSVAIDEQPKRALIGAARLFTGDIAGADEIVDHLPATPVKLDHGAGYCLVVPTEALQMALPLLASLRDRSRLVAWSTEQAALRHWLEQHPSQLAWDEARSQYRIASRDIAGGK